MTARVWIPAVPLPLQGWRTDRCGCGKKFRGRDRRAAYEMHWRVEHEPSVDGCAQTETSWEDAYRIYYEVEKQRELSRGRET